MNRADRAQGLHRVETWAREVLTPWQQAAAVILVVKLPDGTATDDHRTVIRNLADARQRLDASDLKSTSCPRTR